MFAREGTTIYKARNELKVYRVGGLDVVVKSFKQPVFVNRVAYTFFRPSKAERSYRHALRLIASGVPTPDPLAYIEEKRRGLLSRSYYVSIYEKEYSEIRPQMLGRGVDAPFIRSLACFVADLHKKGILQKDLSPGNVMWKREGERYSFLLVDVNRAKFLNCLSPRQRYKNFERLSEDKAVVDRLAAEYASVMGEDKDKVCREVKRYVAAFSKKPQF